LSYRNLVLNNVFIPAAVWKLFINVAKVKGDLNKA